MPEQESPDHGPDPSLESIPCSASLRLDPAAKGRSPAGGWKGAALGILFCLTASVPLALAQLTWQEGDGYRRATLPVPSNGQAGFTLLPPGATGITFSNVLSDATVATNRLLEIGSGVALGDVDGDGWVDIYFCGLENDNVLYRNLGQGRFVEITAAAGVACSGQYSTGCALADLDGDGDLDLLVNSLGRGTRAFLNDSHAHFTEITNSNLAPRSGATSLALADVKGDGNLDLYVTHYRTDTFHDRFPSLTVERRRRPDGTMSVEPADRFVGIPGAHGYLEVVERGEPDVLYINRGGGHLVPVRWQVGVFLDEERRALTGALTDWGLSVIFRDLNGDGLPDLYVCNDFVFWPDRLWLNDSGKRYVAAPRTALRCTSLSSMAVDVADINRDGREDIFVADMLHPRREFRAWQRPDTLDGVVNWPVENPEFRPEVPRNTLQLARDDGTFAEIARLAGVAATDWTTCAIFLDVDLDGWEDLLLSTGNNHDVQDMDVIGEIVRAGMPKTLAMRKQNLQKLPRRAAPSVALRNRHDLTFADVSAAWGFNQVGVAHGMALADLDNDGDLDVVMNCMNAPARIYRNNSTAPRLAIRLRGAGANTRGIGAKIIVSGGPVQQSQEMIAGGRFCSSDDPMRVFAAGDARQLEVEIHWRSGQRSRLNNVQPNCVYEIAEPTTTASVPLPAPSAAPLFEDISARLAHIQVDEPFDDFARQPLLPRKLSTLGPGISWVDLDGNGQDDLLIGGGKTGQAAWFRNEGNGRFRPWTESPLPKSNPRDQTSLLVGCGADGITCVIAGEANWEDADTNAPPFRVFAVQPGSASDQSMALRSGRSSTGPLALADVDADGDLDLFVGGRVSAGRYPEPANSCLLLRDQGAFRLGQTFSRLGLVSGAVFTDFDGDGDPDLALACEWDSLRLFRNDQGQFIEVTTAFGLQSLKGWWNGIAAGDFDGDGRIDLVASNWGRNGRTDQPPGAEIPARLIYGEFAGDGIVQTLLASLDPALAKITPWRERKAVVAAIPWIAERLPNYRVYGRASVQEMLGDHAATAHELQANTSDSMVFLNRGDHFEARHLPIEAQFAPAFGISIADFDGDGNEDVFLAQNFFGVDAETSRHDAGTGLVLLGDGQGGFRALGPREAGVAIYGEQRGSAVADFDGDGRMDLAVAQHAGSTRLFRNVRGTPGLRVTLRGPKGNPHAVGAVVRLKCGERWGPAREIHAGSGYWSQDSATSILGGPTRSDRIQVRWPGGKVQEWPVPRGARSIEVSTDGVKRR